jgi:predicted amidohydrolase
MTFLAAVVQLTSTSNEEANWQSARSLIERAAMRGAQLVATPENTNYLGPHEEKVRRAQTVDGPTCQRFAELAARLHVHLLLGSFNERCEEEPTRCYNTSVLFAPHGDVLATYRKMHLFDVDVSPDVRFRESQTIRPGDEPKCIETALAPIGLSICYDVRFPELYRALVDRGAEVITVPSAFTLTTGRDHWYPLLQARAIETQCWVLAPAQAGRHDDQGLRHSYGHSLVIDPWGQVVASVGGDVPGVAMAEIDLERVASVRGKIPVQKHRRL